MFTHLPDVSDAAKLFSMDGQTVVIAFRRSPRRSPVHMRSPFLDRGASLDVAAIPCPISWICMNLSRR